MMQADDISRHMRDVLIEHVDGSAPINISNTRRMKTMNALVARGFLRFGGAGGGNGNGGGHVKARPTHTFITEQGRAMLGAVLADCADALVRAGYGERFAPRLPENPAITGV